MILGGGGGDLIGVIANSCMKWDQWENREAVMTLKNGFRRTNKDYQKAAEGFWLNGNRYFCTSCITVVVFMA